MRDGVMSRAAPRGMLCHFCVIMSRSMARSMARFVYCAWTFSMYNDISARLPEAEVGGVLQHLEWSSSIFLGKRQYQASLLGRLSFVKYLDPQFTLCDFEIPSLTVPRAELASRAVPCRGAAITARLHGTGWVFVARPTARLRNLPFLRAVPWP